MGWWGRIRKIYIPQAIPCGASVATENDGRILCYCHGRFGECDCASIVTQLTDGDEIIMEVREE